MKAITLRQIPPEIAAFIEAEATRTRSSLNATVIRLLEQVVKPPLKLGSDAPKVHRDLDFLAGTWTKEEADEFDRFLADHRRVDAEDWK